MVRAVQAMTRIVASIGSKIRSYPMVFGMLIGLVLLLGVIAIVDWFPSVSEAWDRHNRLVQSTWFTAGFFGVWVNYYWRWRRRGFFWVSMCLFFLVHTLAIAYYATHVRPLVLSEWIILLALESFVIVFGMDWLTRRLGHVGEHRTPAKHKPGCQ
jgi:hypothetical protein